MSTAPPAYPNDKLPSYEEAMTEACKVLEQKFKDDPEAASKALTEALGGQDTDKNFVADIQKLTVTINTLNTLFKKVHDGLFVFDAENYHDETGQVTKFAPKWEVIRTRYTDNLWASKSHSTEIKQRIQMYFETILPMLKDKTVTDQEKFENISYFIGEQVDASDYNEALKKDENKAQEISQEFTNIQTVVSGFKAEFDAYFQRVQDQLDKEITDLRGVISTLEADLESLTKWRNFAAIVAGTGAVVGVVAGGAMAATGVLAPIGVGCAIIGAVAALGGGIAAAVLQSKIANKQSELNSKREELNTLIAKQDRLNTVIKPLVADLDQDMVDIGDKLESLAKIWGYIKTEAQEARIALQKAMDNKAPFLIKTKQIDLSVQSYKKLYLCVDEYVKGYDASTSADKPSS